MNQNCSFLYKDHELLGVERRSHNDRAHVLTLASHYLVHALEGQLSTPLRNKLCTPALDASVISLMNTKEAREKREGQKSLSFRDGS